MNFTSWLFTEEVGFVRKLLPGHQVVYFGKIGLWDIFSALRSGQATKRVLTLAEYQQAAKQKSLQISVTTEAVSGFVISDELAENIQKVIQICENAAYKLASIGFPKYRTVMVFLDHAKEINPITGGGIGGEAVAKEHAFSVERRLVLNAKSDCSGIIIHEHAHMFWDNILSAASKLLFINWYKKNVSGWLAKPDNFLAFSRPNLPSVDMIKQKVVNNLTGGDWSTRWFFAHTLEETVLGMSMESYFALQNAIQNNAPESEKIEHALFERMGRTVKARMKTPEYLSNGSRGRRVEPGDEVTVELLNQDYSILIWEKYGRIEKTVPFNDIQKFVEFSYELLTDDNKKRLKESLELIDQKMSSFFAPKSKAEKIDAAFDKTLKYIFERYATHEGWEYAYDTHMHFGQWYNTWVSMIGRRAKAGKIKSPQDIMQTFADAALQKLYFKTMEPSNLDKRINWDSQKIISAIGSPKGQDLRTVIASKGVIPSDYAGANWFELWAEVVESATKNPNRVSKELKNMLYNILSGVVSGTTKNRPPRRLEIRKKAL